MYAPKNSSREAPESDKRRSQSSLPDYKQIETRVSSLLKKLVEAENERCVCERENPSQPAPELHPSFAFVCMYNRAQGGQDRPEETESCRKSEQS